MAATDPDNIYYDSWSNTVTKNGLKGDLVISALQKCIRRGEEELAVRFAYELYVTSPFHEEKMWNRLLVISVEDIGFGNPQAPGIVKSLYDIHKEFDYGDGDRSLFFVQAIRYLCQCDKERSSDHIKNIVMMENEAGQVPEIPDWTKDMHTMEGRAKGRDIMYFLHEASKVVPEMEDVDDSYRQELIKIWEEKLKEDN